MHKSLAIALVSGFALLGCAKPDRQAGDGIALLPDGNMDYITAVGPGAQVKTLTPDGVKVLWTDGDKIGLLGKAEYTTRLQEPSAQAKFGRTSEAKPEQAGGVYLAVYPASAVSAWSAPDAPESPFCYVTVPTQQTAVKGGWDKSAAVLAASSQTKDFVFKHAVSYLRFEVTAQTGEFVSVRLSSSGKEKISGAQVALRFLSPDQLTVTPGTSAADYVILRGADNSAFQEGTYYMAFLPGSLSDGLSLSFTNAGGLVAEKKIGALTLNSGDVLDYGPVGPLDFAAVTVPLEKAAVYQENGVNQGVVYWINPDDPSQGKIVSAASEEMLWSDGLIWTSKIESTTDGLANYAQFNASTVYTENKDKFFALKYCEDEVFSLIPSILPISLWENPSMAKRLKTVLYPSGSSSTMRASTSSGMIPTSFSSISDEVRASSMGTVTFFFCILSQSRERLITILRIQAYSDPSPWYRKFPMDENTLMNES